MDNEHINAIVGVSPDWREREQLRLAYGLYRQLPIALSDMPTVPEHYVHLADKRPGMLAFTANEMAGQHDRQKITSVVNYITQFFPDVDVHDIHRWTEAIRPDKVRYIRYLSSTDDIVRAYTEGPAFNSCMRYSVHDFSSTVHPVSVYGESDVQLAVHMATETSSPLDTKWQAPLILARALVWPEKKWYGRIFSHGESYSVPFADDLRAEGFTRMDTFDGARLRRIPQGHTFVMPYLDIGERVSDDGKWMVIDEDGDLNCHQTNGLCEESDEGAYCPRCDDYDNDPEEFCTVYIRGGRESWCLNCSNDHTFYCEGTHRHYCDEDFNSVEVGCSTYESDYASDHFGYCDRLEEYTNEDVSDVIVSVYPHRIGENWCESAIADHAVMCEYTDQYYSDEIATLMPVTAADGSTLEVPDIALHEHDIYLVEGKLYFADAVPEGEQLTLTLAAE